MSYDRNGKAARTRTATIREIPDRRMALSEIIREKWPVDFIDGLRNRIIGGTMRYGAEGGSQYESRETGDSFLRRLRLKLDEFERTRNHEMLLDIAAYCGLLWRFDDSRRAHFAAQDQGRPDEEDIKRELMGIE